MLFVGLSQFALLLLDGGSATIALLDLVFIGGPGAILVYAGYWLPGSEIPANYYPRILGWISGGVAVMFGFILLCDLHPGVSADWSVGTQAIALMIGSIGGLMIGVEQTTARVRAEELETRARELTEQERRLTRQNEQLEQFADVVSHDLRNPLNVAQGRLTLAQEECDSEHLDDVDQAHARMETLIEDLLTLSRQGDTAVDPEPIDLATVARNCWSNVKTGDAELSVALDRAILADESRVKQLLEDLVRNAIEHGAAGEPVTITVGELPEGFYVEDTGPGIPEPERGDVFEAGYSTNRNGTGFGLSIVAEVVDAHGWEISVVEGTEGGARFEITGVEFAG
nr:HAMP domain-containing sensor histidine kinase [Halolamina sediminis]